MLTSGLKHHHPVWWPERAPALLAAATARRFLAGEPAIHVAERGTKTYSKRDSIARAFSSSFWDDQAMICAVNCDTWSPRPPHRSVCGVHLAYCQFIGVIEIHFYNILVMRQEKLLLVDYKTTEPTTFFLFVCVALPSFLLTHTTRSRRGGSAGRAAGAR